MIKIKGEILNYDFYQPRSGKFLQPYNQPLRFVSIICHTWRNHYRKNTV